MVFVLRWESEKHTEKFIGVSSLRHLLNRIDTAWKHPIRISKEGDQWIITILDKAMKEVRKKIKKMDETTIPEEIAKILKED